MSTLQRRELIELLAVMDSITNFTMTTDDIAEQDHRFCVRFKEKVNELSVSAGDVAFGTDRAESLLCFVQGILAGHVVQSAITSRVYEN